MHARTDNMKTVYPPQTKFAGGIKIFRQKNTLSFFNYNLKPQNMYIGLAQVYYIKPERRIH